MMRIRCPNCDSTHEVPPSVLEGKPRKVRCASCRTVFEAKAETDSPPAMAGIAAAASAATASFALPDSDDALIGDTMVTPMEAEPAAADEFATAEDPDFDMNAAMGQDDLDALFADAPATPEPEPMPAAITAPAPARSESPDPLEAGQDAAALIAAATAAAAAAGAVASDDDEPKPKRRSPHAKPAKRASASVRRSVSSLPRGSARWLASPCFATKPCALRRALPPISR